jgi:hypothetical protein
MLFPPSLPPFLPSSSFSLSFFLSFFVRSFHQNRKRKTTLSNTKIYSNKFLLYLLYSIQINNFIYVCMFIYNYNIIICPSMIRFICDFSFHSEYVIELFDCC